jgi:hypothetical protein
VVEEDGTERLGGVWDYRDDPEGMAFGDGMIDADKAARVADDLAKLGPTRFAALGYIVQPVEESGRRVWSCYRCGARLWSPIWVGDHRRPWCGSCAQAAIGGH